VDRTSAHLARIDWTVLAACCAVALVLDLAYASRLFFGFDDQAHVFIAGVQPWAQFLRELAWDAHPPLSYLLLRWLVPLQGAELWPRLLSILPALGTVVLAFLCARALGMARPVTWLVALIFAVSSTHVNLAISVRVEGQYLAGEPVAHPEPSVVPARGLTHLDTRGERLGHELNQNSISALSVSNRAACSTPVGT